MNNEEKILALLEQMNNRLDSMDGRLDNMDGRLDNMDGRLDNMDGRLNSMDGRLDSMDGQFGGIYGRLDRIEAEQKEFRKVLGRLNENVAKIEVDHGFKLGALYDAQLDAIRSREEAKSVARKVEEHDVRIFALEQAAND